MTQKSIIDDIAVIHKDRQVGLANGLWYYDRYKDLEPLDPGKAVVIADLEGPGVIRQIHITQHPHLNEAGQARGLVLLIYYDDEPEPAVQCPLPDFFGHGCNAKGEFFSSLLIECAPKSYNCYIPMPYRKRARVVVRNDLDKPVMSYSFVEYEKMPAWQEEWGYLHATYSRRAFQLKGDTRVTFLQLQGQGHLIGRQFSIATDEPLFHDFSYVMEGNNEVDLDGRERVLDYLGSEDSFTFSWGFQSQFAGLRAGMPHIDKGNVHSLSLFRFHDHMPIRFQRELRWTIDWTYEFKTNLVGEITPYMNKIDDAAQAGGCWVDYATVFYWYQDDPAGYQHEPLAPVQERSKMLLRSSKPK
jgi:hypothetical protein